MPAYGGLMDRLLPWLRRSGWLYGIAAVALLVLAWRVSGGGGAPDTGAPPSTRVQRRPLVTAEPLVHVAGAVKRPGVYRIGGDSRVIQAVRLAGGPTPGADLSGLNLAAPVADGQQIVVPRRAPVSAGGGAGSGAGGRSGPVSLSSATQSDLEALDGVGPALATRIIEWRKAHGGFSSLDQLDEVPGIGPARMETLRPHLAP